MSGRTESVFSVDPNNGDPSSSREGLILGMNKIRPFKPNVCQYVLKRSSGKYDITDNEPLTLLGGKYKLKRKWDSFYKYVFCEFRETIEAVKSGKFDLSNTRYFTGVGDMLSLGFDTKKLIELNWQHCNELGVVRALIYKLLVLDYCMKKKTAKGDLKTAFQLQLFMDYHLDLSVSIKYNSIYTNEKLLIPENNPIDPSRSVLSDFYPSVASVAYCGELPDITPLVDMGNIWYEIRPKKTTILTTIMHLLVCKMQSHKCMTRNTSDIVAKYFKQFPVIEKIYRMLIEVSLMGNYPFSKFRPCYSARMSIRNFISYSQTSAEDMINWIMEYHFLVRVISIEFYIYQSQWQYVIDLMLNAYTKWELTKSAVMQCVDTVRSILSRKYNEEGVIKECEQYADGIHKKKLIKYFFKLYKMGFVDKMFAECNKYFENHVIDKKLPDYISSEEVLTENTLEMLDIIIRKINLREDGKLEFVWLEKCGMSKEGEDKERTLYYAYQTGELADHPIQKRIGDIFRNNNKDFHVFRVMMKKLVYSRQFSYSFMPKKSVERQITALRNKHFMMPWEELPEMYYIRYFCPVCLKWAHPIVSDNKPYTYINIYEKAFDMALYDLETGKLFCGKCTLHPNSKKIKNILTSEKDKVLDQKMIKIQRKMKETGINGEVPLVAVNMLGRIQKVNKKSWALCEACANIAQYHPKNLSELGFTCGMHGIERDEKTIEIPEDKIISDEDASKKKLESPIDVARKSVGLKSIYEEKKCHYCGSLGKRDKKLITLKTINDDPESISIKDITLCYYDYKCAADLFQGNREPLYHHVISRIRDTRLNRNIPTAGKKKSGINKKF